MTSVSIIADAIGEAARWHLLALLFERPGPGWHARVDALAREVTDPILKSVAQAVEGATEGDYLRAFGPGGLVSPREAGHAGLRDPGWILADLAHVYDAFGYRPRAEDPPDHIAVEVGFVAYLHLKEALARSCTDDEAAAVTSAAREAFVREHLAAFARSLARRLVPDDLPHLAGAADLVAARMPLVTAPAGPDDVDPVADGCGNCGSA
jgi:nitrate reductase assembly molybdenum cofactor insertion protein NarJ